MMELVNILVLKRLSVPVISGCNFCEQFVKRIYLENCSVELNDASTVPIVRYYGMQRSVVTKNKKIASFSKRGRNVFSKIHFTQRSCTAPFSQAMITIETER